MITINNLSYKYDKESSYALKDINFKINRGDFVVVAGNSGDGKSTLLKVINDFTGLTGYVSGQVTNDESVSMGFLAQDIDAMIVCEKVWQELAFGLENQGKTVDYMRRKIAELVSYFNISEIYHRDIYSLSGGMKQIVGLASIMSTSPDVLLLDEPLSMLDKAAGEKLIALLKRLNEEFGTTIIISEHKIGALLSVANRLLVLENGQIVYDDAPAKIAKLNNSDCKYVNSLPDFMKIYFGLTCDDQAPLSIKETRQYILNNYQKLLENGPLEIVRKEASFEGESLIKLKNVSYAYDKKEAEVLKNINLEITRGSIHYIIGSNGSGKTTLMSLIAGVLAGGYYGKLDIKGSKVMLCQNPRLIFSHETIREELMNYNKLLGRADMSRVDEVVDFMNLKSVLNSHPYDVSGGEIERAAIAKILLSDADIILLDEPTKGMDGSFLIEFESILGKLKKIGKTIVIVSHDVDYAAITADKISLLFDGEIVSTLSPADFFYDNQLYTTNVIKTSRGIVNNALTVGEVCSALNPQYENKSSDNKPDDDSGNDKGNDKKGDASAKKDVIKSGEKVQSNSYTTSVELLKNVKADTKAADGLFGVLFALVAFVLIPATIWFGMTKLDNRRYTFISLSILLLAMLPAYITFEKRKRTTTELVVLACMSALTVISRLVFYMLPNFKPVIAMVVISGVALGPFDGFMVGMLSMLVSNMIFMQGPWTPWQMFAMGLVGFVAGFVGKIGWVRKNRIALAVTGAIMCFVIYGLIMNPASVLMYQGQANISMIIASYVTGFPFDCVQAVATFIFLIMMAKPFIKKLDRIVKYI